LPPSKDALYKRLIKRGQDSNVIIQNRMKQAINEMTHYSEYDYLIINDDFNQAINNLLTIISAEHLCLLKQQDKHNILISKLLKY
jgi:guanylate kinase